jgi:putative drug exporter of the RND superfamily
MSPTPSPAAHRGALARLARACAAHGWRTIAIWVVAVVAIAGAAQTVGGSLVDDFNLPGSDTQRATDLLESRFPARSGDSADMVFAVESGRLDRGEARTAVAAAIAAAEEVPGVVAVSDPLAEGGALSDDGRIALADVRFSTPAVEVDTASATQLQDDARAAAAAGGVQVEFGGAVIANAEPPSTGVSELIGILVAMVILLVMLGSAVAMSLPIALAISSVGVGISLITIAAGVWTFNSITPTLATMIGLGVGIDYSLFIVTRFRQALHDGRSPLDAATVAASTAGRAVIFAGVTVAISISALAILGLDFITKMGLGAAITVGVAVIAAVTLLPAILGLLGHRIDSGRVPFMRHRDDSEATRENSGVARFGRFVTRRPWATGGTAVLVLIALALPAATVQLGSSDAGSNPVGSTTRAAYDLLAEGFGPGFNGPLLVAVDQRADPGAAEAVAAAVRGTEGVASVSEPAVNEAGDTAVITAYPTTSPQSEETAALVHDLRDRVVPAALGDGGASAFVGGQTAAYEDIASILEGRQPVFLLTVIGIIFVLITMAFRSVVVAAKAALTTLLSALAAFGVLVAVFQHGWGAGLLGVDSTGPIESFLPVIVFAILFGLSTDYEVFLMSRIREEYVAGRSSRDAIGHGIAAIGRVVVACALIMCAVFFSFLLGDERAIKEFGLGLGAAIAIDAFVVRLVIVPAVMQILGDRAWYMPRWLDRVLPRITIEPPEERVASTPAPIGDPAPEAR